MSLQKIFESLKFYENKFCDLEYNEFLEYDKKHKILMNEISPNGIEIESFSSKSRLLLLKKSVTDTDGYDSTCPNYY